MINVIGYLELRIFVLLTGLTTKIEGKEGFIVPLSRHI